MYVRLESLPLYVKYKVPSRLSIFLRERIQTHSILYVKLYLCKAIQCTCTYADLEKDKLLHNQVWSQNAFTRRKKGVNIFKKFLIY